MTRRPLPWVFRISAAMMVAAIVVGGWWQRQPTGPNGRAFLALVEDACPAALPTGRTATVADTAHALDHWGYARLTAMILRDGHDRCAWKATR